MLRWTIFGLDRFHRIARRRCQDRLAQEDQTLDSFFVLTAVGQFRDISQQALCERLRVDPSEMVRLVDHLEIRQWVKRGVSPHDHRQKRLELTPLGRTKLESCEKILTVVIDELLAALSSDERQTLHDLTLRALGWPSGRGDDRHGESGWDSVTPPVT